MNLMLFVIVSASAWGSQAGDIPLIQWSSGCDTYAVSEAGTFPIVWFISSESGRTPAQCRALCTADAQCGGFVITTSGECRLRNINDQLIADRNLTANWYRETGRNDLVWHSKTCPYSLGASDLECADYSHVHENREIQIFSEWRLAHTGNIPDLTPGECQRWCDAYAACRSAMLLYHTVGGWSRCYLYSTTISALVAGGHRQYVITNSGQGAYANTVYDRWCQDARPYLPAPASSGDV